MATCSPFAILFIISALLEATLALKFPTQYTIPCFRDHPRLNECIQAAGTQLAAKLKDGDPQYKVRPLDPLRVEEMLVTSPGSGATTLTIRMMNLDLTGLSTLEVVDAKVDFDNYRMDVEVKIPIFTISGPYKIRGRIFLLPVVGSGLLNITLPNIRFKTTLQFDKIMKDDFEEYLDVQKVDVKMLVDKLHIHLGSLFNGDKVLGNYINYIMNENWRYIFPEIQPSLEDAVGQIMQEIVHDFLINIPFDELFPRILI